MIEFIIAVPVVYLLYYIFMISKYDDNGKLKKKKERKLINNVKEKIKGFLWGSKDDVLLRGRETKKLKEEKDDIKIPTEVEILINKYHIDLSKVNYKNLLKVIGLMCAIDIGLILGIISYIPTDDVLIQILIGGLLMIPTLLIGYKIVGTYYEKKGLVVKNVKGNKTNKRNRK